MSVFKKFAQERNETLQVVYDDNSSLLPTETVPDEAMTIPYLLSKYTKGVPITGMKIPIDHQTENHDSMDWEKVKDLDLIDHDEMREDLREIEESHKKQVKERAQKAAEKAKQKAEKDNNQKDVPPDKAKAPSAEPSSPNS